MCIYSIKKPEGQLLKYSGMEQLFEIIAQSCIMAIYNVMFLMRDEKEERKKHCI